MLFWLVVVSVKSLPQHNQKTCKKHLKNATKSSQKISQHLALTRKDILVKIFLCQIALKKHYFLSHFGGFFSRAESLNISFIIASGRSLSPQASKFCL